MDEHYHQFIERLADNVEVKEGLYIILEGDLELSVKGLDGKKVEVNRLHKGDFFGEVALLAGRTSSMTATAATDVRVSMS